MSNTKIKDIETLGNLRAKINIKERILKSKDPKSDETFTFYVRDLFYNDWVDLADVVKKQADLLGKVNFKTKLKNTKANQEKILQEKKKVVADYARSNPEFQTEMLDLALHLFAQSVVNEDGTDFGNPEALVKWIRANIDLNDLSEKQDEIVEFDISEKDIEQVEKN